MRNFTGLASDMAQVEKSVLVAHPPERMFELVDRVEDYPLFLPWCGGTTLKSRDARSTIATIHIAYMGIRQSFTTENTKDAPQLMLIKFLVGPFSKLEGEWRFSPLGPTACKIELRLDYTFSNRLFEAMLAPVFGHITNTFVDAFVRRADALFVS